MSKQRYKLKVTLEDFINNKKKNLNNFSIKLAEENKQRLLDIVNDYNIANDGIEFAINSTEFNNEYQEFRQEIYWKLHPIYNDLFKKFDNIIYETIIPGLNILLNDIDYIRVINVKDDMAMFEAYSGTNKMMDFIKYRTNLAFNIAIDNIKDEFNIEILSYKKIKIPISAQEIIKYVQPQLNYLITNKEV